MTKLREKDDKISQLKNELEKYKLNYKIANSILDSPNHYSNTKLIRSGAKKQWQLNNSKSLMITDDSHHLSPDMESKQSIK
jgi:cell shape-determining protein MreC